MPSSMTPAGMTRPMQSVHLAGASRTAAVARGQATRIMCSSSPAPGDSFSGFGKKGKKTPSNKEALIKSLGEISKSQSRVSNRTNLVLGGDEGIEKWKELDQKVNEYPCGRQFKCVGVAEDGFRESMVSAVEGVVGAPLHPENVATRPSSKGKYISVQISVIVKSPEQVLDIFAAMKEDPRLKWVM